MTAGVLVFGGVEELDFAGPWEMLAMWRQVAGGPDCTIVGQTAAAVVCAKGLSVNPQVTFDACPALDILLVPGGQGTRIEVDNRALLDFIARQAADGCTLLSVCTGSFLLQAAGQLHGRRATTHWASLDRLRRFSDVTVVEERWTRDGAVWCSAGVSAGIDMVLAFIADRAGADVAGQVQLAAEYFPDPRVYGGAASHPQTPRYARPSVTSSSA